MQPAHGQAELFVEREGMDRSELEIKAGSFDTGHASIELPGQTEHGVQVQTHLPCQEKVVQDVALPRDEVLLADLEGNTLGIEEIAP